MLEGVAEQPREHEGERRRPVAGQRTGSKLLVDLPAGADTLDQHRAQPAEQFREVDVVVVVLGQHLVDGRDREDPVDRVLERLRGSTRSASRAWSRRSDAHGLQVVLDAVMDLLGEHAAHHGPPVLERHRRLLGDRGEQLPVVLRERRRPVGDELADPAAPPPQRLAQCVLVGASLRPGDLAVLEDEGRPGRREGSIVVLTIASSDSSR